MRVERTTDERTNGRTVDGLCFAVLIGYFVGINALGQVHPDLPSTVHGLEWATPVALVDALARRSIP